MKSIRRLYFYLVAIISIEVVVWGLVGLLRSIVDKTISGGADVLAGALASILVSVPVFLVHWLWAQRVSAREEEEKEATLRAVFLYGILLGTLIPVVQNFLAFIDRSLVQVTGLGVTRAFASFRNQTLADNLIAIVMNLIVAAYFWNVLRSEWATLKEKENFTEVRRLYRYIWMLYGLLMTVFGMQQILRYLVFIPGNILGEMGRETLVNGVALLVVGTPLWVYAWRIIQDSLADPSEMGSNLRLGILYILALGAVITVVTTSSILVNVIMTKVFGADWTTKYFVQQISGPISIGIPLGMVWAYYGYWLNRHIEAIGDKVRQAGMKRVYNYILAFIGLVVSFIGVSRLLSFIIDISTRISPLLSQSNRYDIAAAISLLIVGIPLWLMTWRPMQAEALEKSELGDHARRSVLRKTYLYLALFASVIGGMVTAVALAYQLIRIMLTGNIDSDFVNTLLNIIQLLFLFVVVLIYHLNVLRTDGTSLSDVLTKKQSEFSVLIVDTGAGFVETVKVALAKLGAKVQVTVTTPAEKPNGDFGVLILSGNLAMDAPPWIKSFGGNRIIVQDEANDLVWADDAVQAAESVQRMAEGQEIQKKKPVRSAWTYVVYVFAALFAVELLFLLLTFGISLVTGF